MKQRPWSESHPRPWELSLQREIHTANPRSNRQRVVLLGEDDAGLAAITVAEQAQDATVVIECVAVALRCRATGGSGIGDEALDMAMEWAIGRADAAGSDRVLLTGKTDPGNVAGRRLVQKHGFALQERTSTAEIWYQQLEIY